MRRRLLLALATLTAGLFAVASVAFVPTATAASDDSVVEVPVSFAVNNTNRTAVACPPTDGKAYTIRGTIVAPRAALESAEAATLYLHAVTQGEFYWRFRGVEGYDFARQQAENGHVSVVIDRLGYGASDKPPGLASCFGSQADTAHQVVDALRTGDYQTGSGLPVSFGKVFIAGHSAGGLTATIAAYSFPDIAGLINFGWADQTTAPFTVEQVADTERRCALSALGQGTSGRPNYEPFGNDPAGILFHSAEPAVRAAVPAPQPDPCGDLNSFGASIAANQVGVPATRVPVLVVGGAEDMLFPPPALRVQADRYRLGGNQDVTFEQLADTAHGFNYEASHLQSVELVNQWLNERGG